MSDEQLAELEQLRSAQKDIEKKIEFQAALNSLVRVGKGVGLRSDAPIKEFVDEFVTAKVPAEDWLVEQTKRRPYWFDASVGQRVVANLVRGDPFSRRDYSLARQRELMQSSPELTDTLLNSRGKQWR